MKGYCLGKQLVKIALYESISNKKKSTNLIFFSLFYLMVVANITGLVVGTKYTQAAQ
jgi:hypothetical protein